MSLLHSSRLVADLTMLSTLIQSSLHGHHGVSGCGLQVGLDIKYYALSDSPGAPVSAHSKELFRGFSFVAPLLAEVGVSDHTHYHYLLPSRTQCYHQELPVCLQGPRYTCPQ